ncbi:MAG: Flp/Fap pilin component [Geminicoccaceae bacterium]|jgi:Flp pilus assembly pilin Flp|nr:Flp/Fap pilin component [Geminicoccaceae bacterium]
MMVRPWNPTRQRRWQAVALLRRDLGGAVALEYGLLAALVALAILGSLRSLGVSLLNLPLPSLITAFQGALS